MRDDGNRGVSGQSAAKKGTVPTRGLDNRFDQPLFPGKSGIQRGIGAWPPASGWAPAFAGEPEDVTGRDAFIIGPEHILEIYVTCLTGPASAEALRPGHSWRRASIGSSDAARWAGA